MVGDLSLRPGDIPWGNRLGLELVSIGDGLSSLRVDWHAELADEEEALATGVLTSLIDQACGVAVMSRLGRRLAISDSSRPCTRIVPGSSTVASMVVRADAS